MMPLHVFSPTLNQMHVVVFSESVFHVENLLYPPDISFSAFVMWCTLSVGPLLVPRTFKHKVKASICSYKNAQVGFAAQETLNICAARASRWGAVSQRCISDSELGGE